MRRESYRAAARKLRAYADAIERHANPETPQERRALTRAIHATSQYAQRLSQKHRRSQ